MVDPTQDDLDIHPDDDLADDPDVIAGMKRLHQLREAED